MIVLRKQIKENMKKKILLSDIDNRDTRVMGAAPGKNAGPQLRRDNLQFVLTVPRQDVWILLKVIQIDFQKKRFCDKEFSFSYLSLTETCSTLIWLNSIF